MRERTQFRRRQGVRSSELEYLERRTDWNRIANDRLIDTRRCGEADWLPQFGQRIGELSRRRASESGPAGDSDE